MSIGKIQSSRAISGLMPTGYELVGPGDDVLTFRSLGDLLAHLNDGFTNSHYSGKSDAMEIWANTGRSCSVIQFEHSFGIEMADGKSIFETELKHINT